MDAERYLYCLESHKRAVGGVLASSSTEPASWDAVGPGVLSPSVQHADTTSPFGSSKSISRKAVAFAPAVADERPDTLAAVAGGTPGVQQLQRRSHSAHPWLPAAPINSL